MALALLLAAPASRADDASAGFFLDACAGCHTVGSGDLAGPDLLRSTQFPPTDLRAAVKRMEENVGELTDAQIDGLVELLRDPAVTSRLEAAASPAPEAPAAPPPGTPAIGRALFFGEMPLRNGGSPCFACHAAAGRGGTLAKDLTAVHTRLGETALLAATQKPAFPLMKPAYAARPVTLEEAQHLTAFFRESAGKTGAPESPGTVHRAAGGIAAMVLGVVALVSRSRREGVRRRLARGPRGGVE